MRDEIEGKNQGEEGTTPVTTACPEAGKYKCVKKKEKQVHKGRLSSCLKRRFNANAHNLPTFTNIMLSEFQKTSSV